VRSAVATKSDAVTLHLMLPSGLLYELQFHD